MTVAIATISLILIWLHVCTLEQINHKHGVPITGFLYSYVVTKNYL